MRKQIPVPKKPKSSPASTRAKAKKQPAVAPARPSTARRKAPKAKRKKGSPPAPPAAPRAEQTGYSESEFDRLFQQWKLTGDPGLRERMIMLNRNLVLHLARRFHERGEFFEDIVQHGLIGLIYALDHFDPARGVRFTSFATPTIVGEIRRFFRDKIWTMRVPRQMQELHQTLVQRIDTLTQEFGRPPTYEEICRAVNVTVEEIVEALEINQAMEPLSLDEEMPSEEGIAPEFLSDRVGADDPRLENWNAYAGLNEALAKLPERQRMVLKYIYFEGYSQAEIASKWNMSQMYVSRVQRRALTELSKLMREHDAEPARTKK